jgi:hypothetical protein
MNCDRCTTPLTRDGGLVEYRATVQIPGGGRYESEALSFVVCRPCALLVKQDHSRKSLEIR